MAEIHVNGIQLFGFHGCMEEEGRVGRMFEIDVELTADTTKAEQSDSIKDTINYVTIYDIVKEEMDIRSHLIEHVARRIADHLKKVFPQIQELRVMVTKLHPPINGVVASTSVVVSV